VNVALSGDTLQVSTGRSVEAVVVTDKSLSFTGGYDESLTGWTGGRTVIDGGNTGVVFQFIRSTGTVTYINMVHGNDYNTGGSGAQLSSSNGGGMYVDANSHAILTNVTTVFQNAGWWGGGAFVEGRLDMSHANVLVYSNNTENAGGGIYVLNGVLNMFDGSVMQNIASNISYMGGGIYADGSDVSIYDDADVKANVAAGSAGGIYSGMSTVRLISTSGVVPYIGNNEAGYNGGGIRLNQSLLEIEKGAINWNRCSGIGGGIYAQDSTIMMGTGALDTVQFEGNSCGQAGGAICLDNSTANLHNVSCGTGGGGNEAVDFGGGIYVYESDLTIRGGNFFNNILTNSASNSRGGGIATYNSTLLITNGLWLTNTTFFSNAAYSNGLGGAVYITDDGTHTTRMYSVVMYENFATHGGALNTTNATWYATDLTVRTNYADSVGGGLCVAGGYGYIHDGSIIGNQARWDGAGVHGSADCAVEFTSSQPLDTNSWRSAVAFNECGNLGGGLSFFDSDLEMDAVRVVSNRSSQGGGLYAQNISHYRPVWISNSVFRGNVATNWQGGGIFVWGTQLTLEDVDVVNNSALLHYGGGVYQYGHQPLKIHATYRNCEFNGNYSYSQGGAICQIGLGTADLVLDAQGTNVINLQGNYAGHRGGALFACGSTVSMTGNVWMSGNNCPFDGGAIAVTGSVTLISSPSSAGYPAVSLNHAGSDGGGIFCENSTAVFNRIYIGANDAKSNGGGLAITNGALTIDLATFKDNTATNDGGGIWGGNLSLCKIHQMEDPFYSPTNREPLMFKNNVAGDSGGAICLDTCPDFKVAYAQIVSNTANTVGAIYLADCDFETYQSLYAGNQAVQASGIGGIRPWQSTSYVYCCTMVDNDDCAINAGNSEVSVVNSILWGHSVTQIFTSGGTLGVSYSCIQGGQAGMGNITNNPILMSDYHLRYNSPCITNGSWQGGWVDIDQEMRTTSIGWDQFIDTDNDRLPNYVEDNSGSWYDEYQAGTDPDNPDSDGDGQDDGGEWIADVDPTDSNSLFHITSIWRGTDVWVRQVGGSNAYVNLEYVADGTTTNWQLLTTRTPPTAVTNNFQISGTTNITMFRCTANR